MREIKFRFVVEEMHPPHWDKKITFYYFTLDELLEADYDRKGMPHWFTPYEVYHKEYSHGGECIEGKDEWTGLKDKNGQEIYEGDIIRFLVPDCTWSNPQTVQFSRGSFVTKSGSLWGLGYFPFIVHGDKLDFLEVIGNIHEKGE